MKLVNYYICLSLSIISYLNEIDFKLVDFAGMNYCKIHQLLLEVRISLKLVPIQHWFDFLISDNEKHHSLDKPLLIEGEILLLEGQDLRGLLNHRED